MATWSGGRFWIALLFCFERRRLLMKITTFNPMILSPKSEEVISLFEELGFERRHQKDNIDDKDISSVRMKDANGFCVDVARVESMERDMTTMRMNVRDFDEAYAFLKAHGFKNARGEDHTIESKSAKSCLMISPSGYSIQLTQHIREEDK
jgi:hypothetical protein